MGKSAEELRREIEDARGELGNTLGAIGDKVSPGQIVQRRKEAARRRVHDVRNAVMGPLESATDAAHAVGGAGGAAIDGGHSAMSMAGSTAHTVAGMPGAAAGMAKDKAAGTPLVAGAVAFGLGMLVAQLLPRTPLEQQVGGKALEALEPVKEQAKVAVGELQENLLPLAQEAADVAKERATTVVTDVKEQAGTVAEHMGEQVHSSTEQVKSAAT